MLQIWIDPSYTGTGICMVDTSTKKITFRLISQAQTKRAFINYVQAAFNICSELELFLNKLLTLYPSTNIVIHQEAPFPRGLSSAGLYGLQFLMFSLYSKLKLTVKSIPPSFVSSAVKSYMGVKKETISTRKEACQKNKLYVEQFGYVFTNPLELKRAGADVATAMLFWTETYRQGRQWPIVMQSGEPCLQAVKGDKNGDVKKKD